MTTETVTPAPDVTPAEAAAVRIPWFGPTPPGTRWTWSWWWRLAVLASPGLLLGWWAANLLHL
jgi:hypothetical protein